MIVALCLVGLAGLGEKVRVEKPWLAAYDATGKPIWELLAAEVEGTDTGWIAREVKVRVYGDRGEVVLEAFTDELHTDPKGTRWNSTSSLEGEGKNFRFRSQAARWEEGELRLEGLVFESGDLELTARVAVWNREGLWYLQGVTASFGEWELEFPEGTYSQEEETLEIKKGIHARGWDWEVEAKEAVVDVRAQKVTLRGVRVVKA